MTREEAKELLPIIKAFAEGKEIQYRTCSDKWEDIKENERVNFTSPPSDYRIKPEPKYRPFKNQEECWDEMLKHQPFGWIRNNDAQHLYNIDSIGHNSNGIYINKSLLYFDTAFNTCNFVDGTPFGIKEESDEQ